MSTHGSVRALQPYVEQCEWVSAVGGSAGRQRRRAVWRKCDGRLEEAEAGTIALVSRSRCDELSAALVADIECAVVAGTSQNKGRRGPL